MRGSRRPSDGENCALDAAWGELRRRAVHGWSRPGFRTAARQVGRERRAAGKPVRRRPGQALVVLVVVVLAVVRVVAFPGWSMWNSLLLGLVVVAGGCGVVVRRRNVVRLADARGARVFVARGEGCFEVGGWYYLPRTGPGAAAARRSAYELAASVLDWADRYAVCLAVIPETAWHDRLYRTMGFTEPSRPGCRLSSLGRLATRLSPAMPVTVRRPGSGMRPADVAGC